MEMEFYLYAGVRLFLVLKFQWIKSAMCQNFLFYRCIDLKPVELNQK